MSVVQDQFDEDGNPILDEEEEAQGNPITDALGNFVGSAGQALLGFGIAKALGARGGGRKGGNKASKKGLKPKTQSTPSGLGKNAVPRINTSRPAGMSSSIRPPDYPGTPILPPYSLKAPVVPFGKPAAKPPSLLNKLKSKVNRTIRKIVPPKPKPTGKRPPPMPYKLATSKTAPPKPPRKRAGDRNTALQAYRTTKNVMKSEKKVKGMTGDVFKRGEIFNKPLPPPPKPTRSSKEYYKSKLPPLPPGPKRANRPKGPKVGKLINI